MIMKSRFILSVLLSVLLLSACSASPDAANRYEKEIPLIAEVNIPDALSVHQPETIEIILIQDGKRVPGADFVHYELWSHDGSLRDPMTDAVEVGDGIYTVTKTFDKEGLYFSSCTAATTVPSSFPRNRSPSANCPRKSLPICKRVPLHFKKVRQNIIINTRSH